MVEVQTTIMVEVHLVIITGEHQEVTIMVVTQDTTTAQVGEEYTLTMLDTRMKMIPVAEVINATDVM